MISVLPHKFTPIYYAGKIKTAKSLSIICNLSEVFPIYAFENTKEHFLTGLFAIN